MKTIKQLQNCEQQWALITGGAGHVGQTAAETLLELGSNVILLDRNKDALETALTNLKANLKSKLSIESVDIEIHPVVCDMAEKKAIDEALTQIEILCSGQLNVLINNAAFVGTDELEGWCVPFEKQSYNTFQDCVTVNLSAAFYLTQQCMRLMKSHNSPVKSVINISSIYGEVGPQMDMYEGTDMGNPAAYAASKAGLVQFSKWLACVESPHIRANNIVLGGIFRGQDPNFLEKYHSKVPLQRMANEEDIKGAIAYLSSQLSNYMTGQSLFLDGGWTAH